MRRVGDILALVAAGVLLAGCASWHQEANTPTLDPKAVAVPNAFALARDILAQDRTGLAVLLPIEDPAFMALRKAVDEEPPTLQAAQARIDRARALARGASANRKPLLNAEASVSGVRNRFQNFTQDNANFGANIVADWDADIFGGLQNLEKAALMRIDAASAEAAAVRLGIIAAIAANVVDWRTLQAREAVLHEESVVAEELKALANQRARAGLTSTRDDVQAQALIAQVQAQRAALPSEQAAIIGALVALTGREAATILASLQQTAQANAVPKWLMATPAQMLRARPDVAAAEARLRAADVDIAAAAVNRFPKLTLSGTLGVLGFTLGEVFSQEALVGTLATRVAGPLLDFGRVAAQIDQSKALAREAFALYREAVFTALGESETVYGQLEAIEQEYTALLAQEALETEVLTLLTLRYRSGLSDFRDVLNAQRALNNTRAQVARAKGRALRARVALWQALGGS
jgi:multidrug efflux system outer membrane protein